MNFARIALRIHLRSHPHRLCWAYTGCDRCAKLLRQSRRLTRDHWS